MKDRWSLRPLEPFSLAYQFKPFQLILQIILKLVNTHSHLFLVGCHFSDFAHALFDFLEIAGEVLFKLFLLLLELDARR